MLVDGGGESWLVWSSLNDFELMVEHRQILPKKMRKNFIWYVPMGKPEAVDKFE